MARAATSRRSPGWRRASPVAATRTRRRPEAAPRLGFRPGIGFCCVAAEHPATQRIRPGQQETTEVAKTAAKERVTIPVVEERAVVRKHRKVTGAVRVRTEVREAVEVVNAPLAVERVEAERVPLDHWLDAPVPGRPEGATTAITLHGGGGAGGKRRRATEEGRHTPPSSPRP